MSSITGRAPDAVAEGVPEHCSVDGCSVARARTVTWVRVRRSTRTSRYAVWTPTRPQPDGTILVIVLASWPRSGPDAYTWSSRVGLRCENARARVASRDTNTCAAPAGLIVRAPGTVLARGGADARAGA